MSSTATLPDPAVLDALLGAADAFPIADLERTPAEIVPDIAACIPDGGGRWSAATVGDDGQTALAVVVSFDVASGLFAANGKSAKLGAALTAGAKRLGAKLGDVRTGRDEPELAEVLGDGRTICALRLHSGGEHVATVVLARRPDEVDEQPSETAEFPPLPAADERSAPRPAPTGDARALSVIRSVEMQVTAELGRATMTVRELLELTPGSVIELDRAAGSPVDLLVNGTIIARGEVVVVDEEYGIRVSEIVGPPEDL